MEERVMTVKEKERDKREKKVNHTERSGGDYELETERWKRRGIRDIKGLGKEREKWYG